MVEQAPLGPRDQSMEDFEASIRGMARAWLRDVSPYIGLSVDDAHARAKTLGDFLCVHHGPTAHRVNARSDRVHLETGPDGRVESAALDAPPPWAWARTAIDTEGSALSASTHQERRAWQE